MFPANIKVRVEIGSWPLPLERELLPRKHVVEVGAFLAKTAGVDRSVSAEITEGQNVLVRVSP